MGFKLFLAFRPKKLVQVFFAWKPEKIVNGSLTGLAFFGARQRTQVGGGPEKFWRGTFRQVGGCRRREMNCTLAFLLQSAAAAK